MISVTEAAKKELKNILLSAKIDESIVGLRLIEISEGDLGLIPDHVKEDDEIMSVNGFKILIIKNELLIELDNIKIDYVNTSQGQSLVIIDG